MLTLYGANDVAKALDTCRTVLQALASGRLPINKRLLEDVVHTLLIELVERAASPMRSGLQCFYDLLRGVGHNYNLAFARRLRGVTAKHVQECISRTILSLFGPSTAVIICCAAGLAVPIRRSLQGRTGNRRVEMLTLKDCIQRAVLVRCRRICVGICVVPSCSLKRMLDVRSRPKVTMTPSAPRPVMRTRRWVPRWCLRRPAG